MQSSITLDDVLASAGKYNGCVLVADLKKVRDLKKINPKSKFDTAYIPLLFKHVNGKNMKVKIKFNEQLIASNAKAPQGASDDEAPKQLNVAFMCMKRGDIEGGDYVPKGKETKDEQEKENKRVSDNIQRYMANNEKFINVLNIIDASYKSVCKELMGDENSLPFKIRKDRKAKDIPIWSMKQATRLDKETDVEEKLENPIYRLKISVCKHKDHNGKIGIWSNYHNEFKPTVFDARKMTKKNNFQPVPAKVKVDGKMRDLDVNTASSFIVYKSLIGGTITFECIVASKFGLSLSNSFYDMYVFRHKTKEEQQTIGRDEILAMRGGCEEEESDSDPELEIVDNNVDNCDDEEEDVTANEPHDSDEEEDDDEEQ